jgi:hypothetical protein
MDTVSGTDSDCANVSSMAVTVNEVLTTGALDEARTVRVAPPEPGVMLAGDAVTVTPCGRWLIVSCKVAWKLLSTAPQLT